jgi:hypothetical protein
MRQPAGGMLRVPEPYLEPPAASRCGAPVSSQPIIDVVAYEVERLRAETKRDNEWRDYTASSAKLSNTQDEPQPAARSAEWPGLAGIRRIDRFGRG